MPLEQWIGRACLLGCDALERRSAVSADHVLAWETRHGRIERGDIAVFEFGWWRKWALRPDDAAFLTDWPGLGLDCVELLLERGVKAVGADTLSPDVFGDAASPVHKALLGEGGRHHRAGTRRRAGSIRRRELHPAVANWLVT